MRSKALIIFSHGLGDVVQATCFFRYLYEQGYIVDLMCRKQVISTHLLDHCPYVADMIPIINPWASSLGKTRQEEVNIEMFDKLKKDYDFTGACLHNNCIAPKIDQNFVECYINPDGKSKQLEVFISPNAERIAKEYISKHYSDGFIHKHTMIREHRWHDWESEGWIKNNLPSLPIFDTGYTGKEFLMWEDINVTFAMIKYATHRVYSSSVMVHVADAMNKKIDVINYGRNDSKVRPLDICKVLSIREAGKWIRKDGKWIK